jgi:predicted nucleic acid-binding Zn ribbon protein
MARGRLQPVAEILSELMARRGYARIHGQEALCEAWTAAVSETIARQSAVGSLRRGVLEVSVANSMLVQELGFQKEALLPRLRAELPRQTIKDLRFRVGTIR